MPSERVVVVGTTADYVEHIRSRYPERALFVTDRAERSRALEAAPASEEEVVADLTDEQAVLQALIAHLKRWKMRVAGVACFDCESMMLASAVAQTMKVPFPAVNVVAWCRNKYLTRQRWNDSTVPCPKSAIIRTSLEASAFLKQEGSPVVLKPLSGSGSELVFKCQDERECGWAFAQIQTRLARHANVRMYRNETCYPAGTNPHDALMVEEFLEGKEYSFDFLVDGARAEIIRVAEKIAADAHSFGTTLAYRVPGVLPDRLSRGRLENVFQKAAQAVGVDRAVCMADVIVNDHGLFLLELSPRPGGDCLPPLIFQSCGLDMLGLSLDVAEGRAVTVPAQEQWTPMVGVRVLADKAGVVRSIDDAALRQDGRARECSYKARPGYRIILPPDDYDSRVLGHIIFEPNRERYWQDQCFEVLKDVRVDIV